MMDMTNVFNIEEIENNENPIVVFNIKPLFRSDVDTMLDKGWSLYSYGTGLLIDKSSAIEDIGRKVIKIGNPHHIIDYDHEIRRALTSVYKEKTDNKPSIVVFTKLFGDNISGDKTVDMRIESAIRAIESRTRLDSRFYYPLYPYGVDTRNKLTIYSPVYIVELWGCDDVNTK